MKRIVALAPLVLVALAASACASLQEGGGEGGSARGGRGLGPYLGGSLLHSFEDFDGLPGADDSDFGLGFRAGVRVHERLAVEGVAEGAFGYDLSDRRNSAELDIVSVGAQGKVFLATGEVEPYVLGGFGGSSARVRHFDVDEDGPYVRMGLGADWHLTPSTSLFAEVVRNWPAGDLHRLDRTDLHLGVLFHF